MGEMRKWSLKKPLFGRVVDKTHLKAMTSTRGQHYIYKEKSIPSRKRDEHFLQQDKGASWFIKGSLILLASDNKCF
jgi:hypothetical protein